MFRGKFGDSIQHVDQGKCLIGSMAVPVERIAFWNTRATDDTGLAIDEWRAMLCAPDGTRATEAEAELVRSASEKNELRLMVDALEAERDNPPRVRPLIWESPSNINNWIYQAHAPWGTYGIHICGGKHQAWLEAHEKPYERWLGDGYVGSVMEAQSVADLDHRRRVLDLLCDRAALTGEPQG